MLSSRVSVAPMMGYTDRFFRALLRCLNSEIILYTQMIPCGKVLHRDDWCERFVYSKDQGRVIVQLGGGNPSELAASTDRLVALGYTEINLNVGCPSARVQLGNIGAVLFKDPKLVAECVRAALAALGRLTGHVDVERVLDHIFSEFCIGK